MVHFNDIDNKKLCKDFFKRMQFVSFAGGGAMGDGGAVIAVKTYGKVFYGNIAYEHKGHELLDYEKLSEAFPILKVNSIDEVEAAGWKHIYMGFGNNLFVRKDIYDEFWEAVSSHYAKEEAAYLDRGWDIEIYLYRNWVDVALEVIENRKNRRSRRSEQ